MGRIATRHYNDDSLNALKLTDNFRDGKWARVHFDHTPSINAGDGYGDPTGTAADVNSVYFEGLPGIYADQIVKGTQTILSPVINALGLDVSQDQTDNDGVEYVFGGNTALSRFAFTVGTDKAFFIKLRFVITDVSGTDDCAVGFRKQEAAQANIDDYDEMAVLNVISGNIFTETILNAAATVSTDTTSNWADTETHTLEVRVRGRRAEYLIDDNPPSGIPAYDFDSGEVVVPFFFFLQASDVTPLYWRELELGLLSEVNTNGIAS